MEEGLKRGELWIGSGGADYMGKPRPVLVLQSGAYVLDSITICPLTTTMLPISIRLTLQPSASNGLRGQCSVMIDKITTVPRSKLDKRIGQLSAAELNTVDGMLLAFLGLAAAPTN